MFYKKLLCFMLELHFCLRITVIGTFMVTGVFDDEESDGEVRFEVGGL